RGRYREDDAVVHHDDDDTTTTRTIEASRKRTRTEAREEGSLDRPPTTVALPAAGADAAKGRPGAGGLVQRARGTTGDKSTCARDPLLQRLIGTNKKL
ncbi:hypothetical protein GWI33_008019, partial [Rhynchophorus ferrugineus]